MELIDKAALVQDLLDKSFYPAIVRRAIEQQPVIDAVDVRHGYWIGPGEYVTTAYGHLDIYKCSECGANITIDDHDSFCPACGCRMDGRRESEGT